MNNKEKYGKWVFFLFAAEHIFSYQIKTTKMKCVGSSVIVANVC